MGGACLKQSARDLLFGQYFSKDEQVPLGVSTVAQNMRGHGHKERLCFADFFYCKYQQLTYLTSLVWIDKERILKVGNVILQKIGWLMVLLKIGKYEGKKYIKNLIY